MSTNQYGLDNDYFERKIAILHRDGLRNWTPDELARELARMSRTADNTVMYEYEFCGEIIDEKKALIASLRNDLQEAIAIDCDDDAKDACDEVERTGTPGSVIREMNDELVDMRAKLTERDARLEELEQRESESGIATKLINKWVNDHCQPIPWDKCIEIIAIITKMSGEEKQRLLDLGDDLPQASAEPSAPDCLTCSDHGAVGNILNAEPCPDCTQIPKMEI
jgi:hypothetical protein